MNIFITGANSFVGIELIKKLKLNRKIKIFGCDLSKNKNTNIHFIKADIRKKDIYKKLKNKIDIIIHLAAISRDQDCSKDLYECYNTNVNGTLNMLDVANKMKVKKFIFASTEWVYDNENAKIGVNENTEIGLDKLSSDYAKSKLISEDHCKSFYKKYKIDMSILRFGIIYGERFSNWSAVEAIFNNVKQKNNISVGSLKTSRKFIHIKDICDGIIKTTKLKNFNIINLQGNKLISLKNIINMSEKILKKKVVIEEKNSEEPSIRKVSSLISNKKIKFKPKISLEQGLLGLNNYLKNKSILQ